jgi:hypothetical protein
VATVAAVAVAVGWSASPASQAARNRCHRISNVRAFGRRADLDCLSYGARIAVPCFASCWPWMIAVMGIDRGHFAAVMAVTATLVLERALPPAAARWQAPPALQALNALTVRQKVLGKP